jgi:hypothetical protein
LGFLRLEGVEFAYTSSFGDLVCFFVPSSGRGFLFLFPVIFPMSLLLDILKSSSIPHWARRSLKVEFGLWETRRIEPHVVWSLHNHIFNMDYRELKEIRRVLRNREEPIQTNRTSIFIATIKIHENEQQESLK